MQGAKGGFDYGQDIVDDGGSRFDFRRGMVREIVNTAFQMIPGKQSGIK